MTQEATGPVYAPELEGGEWIQGDPVMIHGSRRPVLLDFWNYTCVNCLRTLPCVTEWHRKYAEHGLMVVGVHTPEFSFAKNPEHVRRAVASLGIEYPVVLDADLKIWQAYANRYWPAKYFIDVTGKLRTHHTGEGGYAESEQALQALISEQEGFTGPLPELMEPVRPEDKTGTVCYRVTPELYCGLARGNIWQHHEHRAGPTEPVHGPREARAGNAALRGRLDSAGGERGAAVRGTWDEPDAPRLHGGRLESGAASAGHGRDGDAAGADRRRDGGRDCGRGRAGRVVSIDSPRMFSLIRNDEVEQHTLTLSSVSDGLAAFAFTFTSCVAPPLETEA
jgi:thiol-disulfide isomerase/thioredoxin